MCQQRLSELESRTANRLRAWLSLGLNNTSNSTDFTHTRAQATDAQHRAKGQRQASCMADTERRRKTSLVPEQLAAAIQAATDKKALELRVLDLRKAGGFTDYFLVCSGANNRQTRAIADGIAEALAETGARAAHVEGYDRSEWILLDYFDFVVHIFLPETRQFYDLERLWGSAEPVAVEQS